VVVGRRGPDGIPGAWRAADGSWHDGGSWLDGD
jgi:hypothetical protein